jgi:urease accessory protein
MMATVMTTRTGLIIIVAKAMIMAKGRSGASRPLVRSSPRKRGPRGSERGLESGLHRNGRSEAAAIYRLMAWLSPAYPVGAFSYSTGIEWAVEAGDINNAETLRRWLAAMLGQGGGFCDAVLFVEAYQATAAGDDQRLRAVAELAAALVSSRERFLETTAQGRAFLDATHAAWPCPALARFAGVWNGAVALPIAVGVACAGHGIAGETALPAFLHALVANWISAGVRLIPLGQTDGQRVIAAMEETVAATAARALTTPLQDIGGAAFRADIAAMRHEAQYTRLFRS